MRRHDPQGTFAEIASGAGPARNAATARKFSAARPSDRPRHIPDALSSTACVLCDTENTELLFEGRGFDSPDETFDVVLCPTCSVAFTRPFLPSDELARYYSHEYYGGATEGRPGLQKFTPAIERLVRLANRRRATAFLKALPHMGRRPQQIRILDVGCGRGGFLREVGSRGYDCTGTDIGSFDADFDDSFKFHQGSLESHRFPAASFDAVRIWHVLEHVYDPAGTLAECRRVIKSSGRILLAVPNFGSWQAACFGAAWFHLDLPRHLYHFTPQGLQKLLAAAGFEVVHERTLSWEQNVYGCIQSLQNATDPKRPNRLYRLLKNRDRTGSKLSMAAAKHLALAFLSLPAALAETALATLSGRGATLIVEARPTL